MNCPHCQAPVAEGSRFCGVCGRAAIGTTEGAPVADAAKEWIGREIAGRYRIKSKLGEGGMGAVFKAEQISLRRVVALKLLRPELVASPTLLRRFNAEAEAVAKLNHPNTVNIYDFGQDRDGTLYIAMELIEGQSLRAALVAEGPLSIGRAAWIAAQVAASLGDAHNAGIVHRDLKPDNIMLQERGRTKDVVRVLDFGIAKLRDDSRATTQQSMTQAGDVLGTPQYMSPEQIRGEEIDGRSDIYSLGAILYEMVTGRMVFEASTLVTILSKHLLDQPEPPSRRRPELSLPPAIDDLVMWCLAKDPRGRPASMEPLSERLMALAQSLGQSTSSGDLIYRQGSLGDVPASRPPSSAGALALAPTGAVAPGGPTVATPLPQAPMGGPVAPPPSVAPPSVAGPPVPPPALPPMAGPALPSPGASPPPAVPPSVPPGAVVPAMPTPPPYGAAPAPYSGHAGYPHVAYAPGVQALPPYSPVPLGGYPAPPSAPPPSSGSRTMVIALTVLGLLIAGGAGLFFVQRGKSKPAEPQRPTSPESPWGKDPGGADSPSTPSTPDTPDPAPSGNDDDDDDDSSGTALGPMRPPKLGNVGGKLYSARGFFRFLVPDELSASPEQHAVPDGSGSAWSFPGQNGTAAVVIASPLPPEIDPSDPASAVKEFGAAQGMQTLSWHWREIQGQKTLGGIYKIVASGVEMRAESVLYTKAQGFLIVTFLCPAAVFDASQDYRDVLFGQRISW